MAKTILVVDDDADIRKTVKEILEHYKFATLMAPSGQSCLNKLKRTTPDLILLDIMMPGMSGWSVCSKIKTDEKLKNIPVVFLTAKSDEISEAMGLKGAEGFIAKPFDPLELIRNVKRFL